jgi:4a-hydroxytetrahydrobiopterin dehydratase
VTVRLRTRDADGLSERDVELARQISAVAREPDVPVGPTGLQIVQVAIDALVIPDVLPFWRAVLGYQGLDDEDLLDPHLQGPPFWFQQMDAPRPQRNRIHGLRTAQNASSVAPGRMHPTHGRANRVSSRSRSPG